MTTPTAHDQRARTAGPPRAGARLRGSQWGRAIGSFFVPERKVGSGPAVGPPPSVRAAERLRKLPIPSLPEKAERDPDEEPGDLGIRTAALTLGIIGLSLLVFLAYAFVFTGFQEAREQRSLLNAYQSLSRGKLLSLAPVAEGQPVGILLVPRLGLRQVVVQGTSATDLLKGPGLMPGTSLPGTLGNSVIAGRRSTAGAPFGSLGQLRSGDPVTVVTVLGSFHYRVDRVGTAGPGDQDPISQTSTARLTMVTSNPPILTTGRLYATAQLVSKPAIAPYPKNAPELAQRGLSGDANAIAPSILWGLILIAAVVAVISWYRRQPERIWPIYLLSTPLLVAIMLLWFENLFRLLPATL